MQYINNAIAVFLWMIPFSAAARIAYILASVAINGAEDKSYVRRIKNTFIFAAIGGSAILIRQILVAYLT